MVKTSRPFGTCAAPVMTRKSKSSNHEEAVPLPFGTPTGDVTAVFASVEFQKGNTPPDAVLPLTDEDRKWIEDTTQAGRKTTPAPSLAAERYLTAHFKQYNFDLPVTQAQWQNFVLAKLVEQANDLDPKISKPALDTLAKTSVVGLMVERQEINITHKTSDELEATLRSAMRKYLQKNEERVIEGTVLRA